MPALDLRRGTTAGCRHTLDGTLAVFLSELLVLPTGLVIAALLTRRFGPGAYGVFTLTATLIAWIEWSISSLFSRPTIRLVSEAEDWQPVGTTIVWLHSLLGAGAALLLFLAAAPLARAFHEPILAGYLRLFAADIPLFCAAQAHRSLLIGLGRFRQRALGSAARWMVRLLLVVLLVRAGLSVSGAILGTIGASAIELLVLRCYVRPRFFCRSAFPVRRLWEYALPLFLFALSMRAFEKLDLAALKLLGATAAQAGLYGAAQSLALLPGLFAMSFSPLLLASLTRALRSGDLPAARALGRQAMRLVLALLPLAGLIAAAAPEMVAWIFGPRFHASAPVLAVLMLGAPAMVLIAVTTSIMTAADRPHWTVALAAPLLPLAAAGHVLAIPRWGLLGAASVTTACAAAGALAGVIAVYRLWRIRPPVATLARAALIAALTCRVVGWWPTPGALLLIKLPAAAVISLAGFLLLGELSAGEMDAALARLRWRRRIGPREEWAK